MIGNCVRIAVVLAGAALAVGGVHASAAQPDEVCMYGAPPSGQDPATQERQTDFGSVEPDSECPPPQVSIWASPQTVGSGGSTTLSWTSQYAWDCTPTGAWAGSGSKGTGGSQGVGPIHSATTYGLSCSGPGGTGGSSTTVNVSAPDPPPPPPDDPPPPPPPGSGCPWVVDEADFVSQQNIPSSMAAGTRATVSVTFKNTGATTWTAGAGYKLGFTNPQDENVWGTSSSWPGRVLLAPGESVSPCQSKTFSFTIRAPATEGTYNFQWRMLQEGVQWFGHWTPNVVIDVTAPNCYSDESIEDYSICDQFAQPDAVAEPVSMYEVGGGVSCEVVWVQITWKQVITGLLLWRYRQEIEWCWNSSRITSISRNRWGEKNGFPGNPWSFEGHQSSNCNTESCSDRAFGQSQIISTGGKFHACAFVVVFCSTKNPYMEVRIHRGGGFEVVRWTW